MNLPVDSPMVWILGTLTAIVGVFLNSLYKSIKSNSEELKILKARQDVTEGSTGIYISALTKNIDSLTADIKQLTANVAHMNGNMKVQSEVISKVFEKMLHKQ